MLRAREGSQPNVAEVIQQVIKIMSTCISRNAAAVEICNVAEIAN